MMKTFHRTKKRNSGKKKFLFILLFVVILIEILFQPIANITFKITAPAVEGVQESRGVVSNIFSAVTNSKFSLQEEIKTLKEERVQLIFENQRGELIRKENDALRRLLGFQEEESFVEGDLMQVIQRPSATRSDELIIYSKGVNDTYLGKEVFYGPYRLGKVSQTKNTFATVSLYGKDEDLTGLLKKEVITLESQGGLLFTGKIPKSITVEKGDVIVLEQYPDMPFIIVTDVTTESDDPFWTFFAKIPVSFTDIEYVTVQ